MKINSRLIQTELVLVGGGHANIQVLKSFAMRPIDGLRISLISDVLSAPYSGMLPGFVAGEYEFQEIHINLLHLCNFAGARFIQTKIMSVDTKKRIIYCKNRPNINYDLISINTGITSDFGEINGAEKYAIAVKPISHFLKKISKIEKIISSSDQSIVIIGSGAAGIELAFALRKKFNKNNIIPKITIVGSAKRFFPELSLKCHLFLIKKCSAADIDVRFGQPVTKVSEKTVTLSTGIKIATDFSLIVTGARPSDWLNSTSIRLTHDGYIEVDNSFRSISDERIFAAGDIAKIKHQPRPRSGVFAVRAGPVLAKNLRLTLNKSPLKSIAQQSNHLSLITLQHDTVMAIWGGFFVSSKWLWPVKKWIDKRFISKFTQLPKIEGANIRSIMLSKNELVAENDPLLQQVFCAGCGSKAEAQILDSMLPDAVEIVVKLGGDRSYLPMVNTLSDASEFFIKSPMEDGQALIQTVDTISQMISDPFIFGRISALHALSDLVVSNAIPLTALSIINIERAKKNIQKSDLTNMLAGAMLEFSKAKIKLIGGHTSQSAENSLGFALTGIARSTSNLGDYNKLVKKNLKDFSIILTKPLGIGLILAANMRNVASEQTYQDCVEIMLQSNLKPAEFLWQNGAVAMTDVTGFGLARHLENLIKVLENDFKTSAAAQLHFNQIPLIPGAAKILEETLIRSNLNTSNKRAVRHLNKFQCQQTPLSDILFDPQTSGGVLAIVPTSKANRICKILKRDIAPLSKVIGDINFHKSGIFIN